MNEFSLPHRRVLVTGASGFVGSGLCRALTNAEYEVVGLVRKPPPEEHHIPGVAYVTGDIRDASSLTEEAFAGCGYVVHCVGIITENHGRGQNFEAVHIGGTDHVLRAARRAGIAGRFVYISAIGADPKASSQYSRTKARAESLVRDSGLPYTIFRPSIIMGPGAEFLHQMEALIRRPPLTPSPLPFVPVPGKGRNRFQPVDLRDLTACVLQSLSDAATAGQTYEIGGADQVTFDELIRGVAARIGKAKKPLLHIPLPLLFAVAPVLEALLPVPPITTDQLLNLQRDNICDNSAIHAAFGMEPRRFEAALDRAYPA